MNQTDSVLESQVQEMKRGTLVLAVLLCTDMRTYGYSLVTLLKERGLDIEQNTLYPLLRRMEQQGLLESSWDTSESRPRRYYIISDAGRTLRTGLLGEWRRMNLVIQGMEAEHGSR